MRGVALFLFVAASVLATGATAQPAVDPELTELLRLRGDIDAQMNGFQSLSDRGSVGAGALLAGYQALERRDFPAACVAWESAAEVSAEAAHLTAECYEHGHGGVTDLDRAVQLYTAAGEAGFGKSLCALGNLHAAGTGVEQDLSRAVDLCQRGAELGDPDAQTDLGDFYLHGLGVEQDFAVARQWYERAVTGHRQPNAAFTLGTMNWRGDGGPQDRAAAARNWRIAYEGGREDAAYYLGVEAADRARVEGGFDRAALEESEHWFSLVEADDANIAHAAEVLAAIRQLLAAIGS